MTTRREFPVGAGSALAAVSAGHAWAQAAPSANQDRVFVCNEDFKHSRGHRSKFQYCFANHQSYELRRGSTSALPARNGRCHADPTSPWSETLYHGAIDIHGAAPPPTILLSPRPDAERATCT